MEKLKKLGAYEYIAFITGFGLLTYELVASRLLAPTIGSSIYIWTSVIGVIIAALSLGYTVGGNLADKRVNPLDISWLLIMSAAGVLSTLMLTPFILALLVDVMSDPRWQGFTSSLLLFAPTSFMIGMISPYLARLKNTSVKTTGSAIASLSAMNALGSIAGTFLTGFIFMAYIGSTQTMVLVSLVLVASSWLILPKQLIQPRTAATITVLIIAGLSLAETNVSAGIKTVDTSTSSYHVIDVKIQGRPVRVLASGPGSYQSGVFLDGDSSLVFSYTKELAKVVDDAPSKDRILILGGGAYTLPEFLARKYPKSVVEVVEIDTQLAQVSKKYFNYNPQPNIIDHHQDARAFLNQTNDQYDVVLVDVFSDTLIPFSVSTTEYAAELARVVRPDGVVAVNYIGSSPGACGTLLSSMFGSYEEHFRSGKLLPLVDKAIEANQNILFAFSQTNLDWLKKSWQEPNFSRSLKLRDNFAPVEHMKAVCQNQ